MRYSGKILVAFLACTLAAGVLMAQSARGGIKGVVVDDGGDYLPGVTVVLSSDALQGTRSTVTDTDGFFRFPLLPPGTYTATFSMSGFQRVEKQNIDVPLEGTVTLDVNMTSTFTEEVVVTSESPVIDVTSPAVGSQFSSQMLDEVPVGRDFKSVTFLATGAVDGGGIRNGYLAGNASIMGASVLENRYVVDQLDTTDEAYGKAGTAISTSFIEEIQVKTAGYEAEYGGALGGVINMITKSGGNEFHGDVFGYFTNDSLWDDAKIPETRGSVTTVDQEYDVGFSLGGKIIEDKLWFFVGYNPNTRDANVRNDVYSATSGDIYQTNSYIVSTDRQYFTGKLTWQLSSGHSITANILGDPTTIDGSKGTSNYVDSPFVAETNQTYAGNNRGGINYGVNWNGIFSDAVFIEASIGRHDGEETYMPVLDAISYADQTADGRWTNGVGDGVAFGGPGFRQPKDNRSRDQVRIGLSVFAGDHEIKLGGGYNGVEFDMDYNVNGPNDAFCGPAPTDNIFFGGEFAWQLDLGTGEYSPMPYTCDYMGTGAGYLQPARVGNRYRLRNSYYYNRNYKNQSTGTTDEFNLFAQDSWRITENLTFTLGVRAESSTSEGNLTKIMPERTLDFGFGDMVAPRVGFVWDPANNGRSKVFAHYGKFYQSIPLDINVRSLGNEKYDFIFYEYPDEGLPSPTNAGELIYYLSSRSEFTGIDPNIKPQYLEEYVFGGEYEVVNNIAVGAKYVRRDLGRVIEDISVDGGNSYFVTNPGGTFTENPATGTPLAEPIDFPTAHRTYDGVEVSVKKRYADNWQGYVSLLWSDLVGNYEGLYSRDNQQIDPNITSKFDLPELLANADGTLQNNREWQFKAYGSYNFDFGLVTGLNMFYATGNPISKLGAHSSYGLDERFVTPRGSEGTMESWLNFDLHLAYAIPLGSNQLEFMVDVFNLLDNQVAVEVDQRWTVYDETDPDPDAQTNDKWGDPLVYSSPRNIRLGVKFSF